VKNWATYTEINNQPRIWRAWADEFGPRTEALRAWIATENPDEIWLCGAGTSAYIGDLIAAHLGASKLRVRAVSTTDFVSCPQNFTRKGLRPLVISFGRSGDSAETIGMLDILDALLPNAPRLNITCNAQSALAQRLPVAAKQEVIALPASCHDRGFAMTSSYTTMLLTALLLLDPTVKPADLHALASAAEGLMTPLFDYAETLEISERAVFVGSGALAFCARESALKVMELTAGDIPVIWESSLGFRHGPKSFVNPKTRVFVYLSGHPFSTQYDADLAAEVRSQFGAQTVTTLGPDAAADIVLPKQVNDAAASVLYVLFAQILATVGSHKMQFNVDNPFEGRGTLTRVVQGVKLYVPVAD
jgi:tagatose-6-phosphate ketose/aldose isomerase